MLPKSFLSSSRRVCGLSEISENARRGVNAVEGIFFFWTLSFILFKVQLTGIQQLSYAEQKTVVEKKLRKKPEPQTQETTTDTEPIPNTKQSQPRKPTQNTKVQAWGHKWKPTLTH